MTLPSKFCAVFGIGLFLALGHLTSAPQVSAQSGQPASVAVGPQYDSTHVYVAHADLEKFVNSFIATFGGTATKAGVTNVAPVPSSTEFQAVISPVGLLSVFAFQTPIPYPLGAERDGYMVSDMDQAIAAARAAGAAVIVEPFSDPIGKDAVIQFPGGVNLQLYSHFAPTKRPPLEFIFENRVYLSRDDADNFVRSFNGFSGGKVISDDKQADAGEIGRKGETYRRIRLESLFGNALVLVTDGHLPYPFGREVTGYEVKELGATLAKAEAAGAKVLSGHYAATDRDTAIVEFPGGYIAEIHSAKSSK